VTDGTSNTILAVEAAEPTIWTRPDDLPFDLKGALPKFGVVPEGFNVLFADGTVRWLRSNINAEVMRALITRNGGEAVDLPD
jgi:prepilin-type processing-associated H-X9-DG protein